MASSKLDNLARNRRPAFTLVEVLVVIGIMLVLVGMLMVAIPKVQKSARRARTTADLQTISVAMEAYKQDFGDYPRLRYTGAGSIGNPRGSTSAMDFMPPAMGGQGAAVIAGSELLAWALVGPYQSAAAGDWSPPDGKDGFGIRVGSTRGTVFGPYVNPEKFLRNPNNDPAYMNPTQRYYMFLQDAFRQPILYFVRNVKPATNAPADMYNVADNSIAFFRGDAVNPPDRFNAIAGKREVRGPYVLWSAGADEQFAVEDPANQGQVDECDDILFSGQ